jgi:hypothetical protein
VISIDGYHVVRSAEQAYHGCCQANQPPEADHTALCLWLRQGRNESDSMRAIYQRHIFPKLAPHQRVAVVPFLGGCACATGIKDGFCDIQSPCVRIAETAIPPALASVPVSKVPGVAATRD